MGEETFNETLLTEKLSKLNSSQQSIESVSRWCISHRKKAKQVVETWDTLFKSAARDQRVSFLYLSNDILQNSRRKGSEFVNEFWKVLPKAIKGVFDSDEDNCKKVASRLVNIWEERKVFGSRGQNLKNEVLGKNPSPIKNPSPANNAKNSNPIKIVKRDANAVRIKLAVGGFPEKILTAFESVYDETVNEEEALSKSRDTVSCVQEIEKDVKNLSSQGNVLGPDVVDNIAKQENMLQQCISQLENFEAIRVALVSQLREALQDQETKLELIRNELHVARSQIEQAANTRLQLTSPPTMNRVVVEPTYPPPQSTNNPSFIPPITTHPLTSFTNPTMITDEESMKAAAAAVAAKLTASMSSAQMLTSALSSLVAEESASMSSGVKRPKLETPMGPANAPYLPPLQAPFLPPQPPVGAPVNQLGQSTMMNLQYGYGGNNNLLLPPSGFARPGPPLQQGQPSHQQGGNGGHYRPAGFYGQSHQPPTPPIHRQ